jgi:hypothetical protein
MAKIMPSNITKEHMELILKMKIKAKDEHNKKNLIILVILNTMMKIKI